MDQYFYSTHIYDDFLILPENEAHHALKVLRKKIGDEIIVVDEITMNTLVVGEALKLTLTRDNRAIEIIGLVP